jgi:hypothetical protein
MAVSGMHILGPIMLKTISPCHAVKVILVPGPELLMGDSFLENGCGSQGSSLPSLVSSVLERLFNFTMQHATLQNCTLNRHLG